MEKKQINVRLQVELYDFIVEYAKLNYKTVTAVIREMIAGLYHQDLISKQMAQKK